LLLAVRRWTDRTDYHSFPSQKEQKECVVDVGVKTENRKQKTANTSFLC